MLKVGVNKRVVFSIDQWTNPEGETGAYLLYSVARIRSIFRKVGEGVDLAAGVGGAGEFGAAVEERALLHHLTRLPAVIERAAAGSDPSGVATWLFDGAKAFSRFYDACPVRDCPDPALRRARLVLIRATDVVMTAGLALLGITPVDEM
jgi:arginyl-tRNA synthetase